MTARRKIAVSSSSKRAARVVTDSGDIPDVAARAACVSLTEAEARAVYRQLEDAWIGDKDYAVLHVLMLKIARAYP